MYVGMYVRIMYIHMYVCMYVCVCVYVCMYYVSVYTFILNSGLQHIAIFHSQRGLIFLLDLRYATSEISTHL